MNSYSFQTFARTSFFYIFSKITYGRNIRIIKGFPRIINKGHLYFGKKFTAGLDLRLEVLAGTASVVIGENVKINDYCHIGAINSIEIGDNCLLGSRVSIVDHEHGIYQAFNDCMQSDPAIPPDERTLKGSPIKIGARTWIGEGVVVLSGVNIGPGCIIGANAVVTKNIPENSIAVGIPAKVIRKYNEGSQAWERI
ncbi:hexapeptide repeat of succinyl-transferase family protein [Pseudomonas fluorescens]|uniref:Hexapeptide repeat of succinyl-transferase family protein n=1 Tax=Pseudomonas fluorescens TaxID=294 RepID=A0A0P8YMG6_PSEFL|nr:DapH/DapD/GlmU-related protein [Pseudomonas fluorescens]KPU52998.1 hexapeptide repeat of succinyl-transferase family protein [Pseudomonas fluorescens]